MEESNTSLIHQLLFNYMLKVSHLCGNISVLPSGAVELCVLMDVSVGGSMSMFMFACEFMCYKKQVVSYTLDLSVVILTV